MAINEEEFSEKIDVGIKSDKKFLKFYIYFRYKNKRYKRLLDYTNKLWDKKTRIMKAKCEIVNIKDEIDNKNEIDSNLKLSDCVENHFSMLDKTEWNKTKVRFYKRYIMNDKIHNMKIKDILHNDIVKLINKQKGKLKEKTLVNFLSILNPIFKEAIANRICIYNPCDNIKIKVPKNKKIILNARDQLKKLIEAVEEVYKKNDFFYCLFMFYVQGRRKSEVLKLEWKNIDIKNGFYVIEDTKNGENQKFILLENIKERLLKIIRLNKYVFPSSKKSDSHIVNIKHAVKKIRDYDKELENFTLKDTRNIITSAMGESGESAIYQSGTLGHKSLKTIDKYSTLNYESGSKKANKIIEEMNS